MSSTPGGRPRNLRVSPAVTVSATSAGRRPSRRPTSRAARATAFSIRAESKGTKRPSRRRTCPGADSPTPAFGAGRAPTSVVPAGACFLRGLLDRLCVLLVQRFGRLRSGGLTGPVVHGQVVHFALH